MVLVRMAAGLWVPSFLSTLRALLIPSTSLSRQSSSHRVSGCQWISVLFPVMQHVPSFYGGVYLGVTEVVRAVKHQYGPCCRSLIPY